MSAFILIFVIVLLGVLVVNVLGRILTNIRDIQAINNPTVPHKLHDWYTMVDEDENELGLICIECGMTPQDFQ